MYSDYEKCAVCGSEVRLRPHPGVSGDNDCPTRRRGGPKA